VGEEGAEGSGVGAAFDAEVGVGEFEMEDAGGCWVGWDGLRGDDADREERGGVAVLQEFLAVAATPGEDQVGVDVVGAGDEGDGGAGGQGFFDDLAAELGGTIGAWAAWRFRRSRTAFRRQVEQDSGVKPNSNRSEATLVF
jgi:hypothetical protein